MMKNKLLATLVATSIFSAPCVFAEESTVRDNEWYVKGYGAFAIASEQKVEGNKMYNSLSKDKRKFKADGCAAVGLAFGATVADPFAVEVDYSFYINPDLKYNGNSEGDNAAANKSQIKADRTVHSVLINGVYSWDLNSVELRGQAGVGGAYVGIKLKPTGFADLLVSKDSQMKLALSGGVGVGVPVNEDFKILGGYKYTHVLGQVKGIGTAFHNITVGLQYSF